MTAPDRLTDDQLIQLLRLRATDAPYGLLDEIVDGAAGVRQARRWPRFAIELTPVQVLLITALLLVAATGAIAVAGGLIRPAPPPIPTIVTGIVETVNARDVASLRSLMAEGGVVEFPSVDARQRREGEVYMSDWEISIPNFPEAWMENLDRWGMEAELGSCEAVAASTMRCAVITRWHTLQVEIGEAWTFELEADRVTRLEMLRVDPDPPDRLLPLGLTDLAAWEAWLRTTHPDQAAHLLPSGPDIFGHMYFRFGLDVSPDEIAASIREFLVRAR